MRGYSSHISMKKAHCGRLLMKLRRFKNLSTRRKRHLYLSLIRSSLIYPATPLHTENKTNQNKLQAIQNRALKSFIIRPDSHHITAEELHQRAKLVPLNQVLHAHAQKTWASIREGIPDLYNKLSRPYNHRNAEQLLSSRRAAEADKPAPIYTYNSR